MTLVEFLIPARNSSVKLSADLSPRYTEGWLRLSLPAGDTIRNTLETHGIELDQPAAAVVNGTASDLDRVLKEGDQVRLLPQIAGG